MKGLKRSALCIFLLLWATIIFSPLPVLANATISIQPSVSTPTVGSIFDVPVNVSGVTDLYAFQFDITFNPTILAAMMVNEGTFLQSSGGFFPGLIDNGAGTISFTADSLIGSVPGVDGNGTLADISFQALTLGTSPIDLSNVVLLDSNLGSISSDSQGGSVTVVAPEPATFFLISMGMVALGIVRKKGREII